MKHKEPLDFWNYPNWGPEGTNNPRDPDYEPFWMRPCKTPTKEPVIRSNRTQYVIGGSKKHEENKHKSNLC